MKPIIGIVGRAYRADNEMNLIGVNELYRKAIFKYGGIPILILPPQDIDYYEIKPSLTPRLTKEEIETLKKQIDLCDGVIFPGGKRIYEYAYEILDYIIKKDIPCLGTCLGMQTIASCINNRNSKKILKKIDSEIEHKKLNDKFVHFVDIVSNSKLYEILSKERILVNSKHSYCIDITSNENLNISAYSEDGIIEGIELKNKRFIIGVQWHPEELLNEDMEKIIEYFIKECKKN